jgi:hypothetical protein
MFAITLAILLGHVAYLWLLAPNLSRSTATPQRYQASFSLCLCGVAWDTCSAALLIYYFGALEVEAETHFA